MAKATLVIGILLIALGVGGFIGSGYAAKTALIPAYVGLPMAILGAIGLKPDFRMHAMHAAVIISLLGFLASAGRLGMALSRGEGSALGRFSLSAMALLTLIHVILCVRCFIAARKARNTEQAA